MSLEEEQDIKNPGRNIIDLGVRRPGQRHTYSAPKLSGLLQKTPHQGFSLHSSQGNVSAAARSEARVRERALETRKQSIIKRLTYKMLGVLEYTQGLERQLKGLKLPHVEAVPQAKMGVPGHHRCIVTKLALSF